jgi:hypothetical protein
MNLQRSVRGRGGGQKAKVRGWWGWCFFFFEGYRLVLWGKGRGARERASSSTSYDLNLKALRMGGGGQW